MPWIQGLWEAVIEAEVGVGVVCDLPISCQFFPFVRSAVQSGVVGGTSTGGRLLLGGGQSFELQEEG